MGERIIKAKPIKKMNLYFNKGIPQVEAEGHYLQASFTFMQVRIFKPEKKALLQ